MAVAMPHHAPTVMVVAHAVPPVMAVAHPMPTMAVAVMHADVDDARRGVDGADHARGGRGGCRDADGSKRGQSGDCEKGLPHRGFLVGCWWPLAKRRRRQAPLAQGDLQERPCSR